MLAPNFLNATCKYILKILILIIHFFTRTPLIVVYYFLVCIGLFGPSHSVTFFCFSTALLLICINIFIFILFNNVLTKQWAINLVGKAFFDQYLTHSAPAAKSLMRLGNGCWVPFVAESITHYQFDQSHHKSCDRVRFDIDAAYANNDMKAVKEFQNTLRTMESSYQPGGVITKAVRSDAVVRTYGVIGDSAKGIMGKITGK